MQNLLAILLFGAAVLFAASEAVKNLSQKRSQITMNAIPLALLFFPFSANQ